MRLPEPRQGLLRRTLTSLSAMPSRFRRITTGGGYVPQIDGLRFLAIFPVLLWHATLRGERFYKGDAAGGLSGLLLGLRPHGHLGVYLFFFISGYIISYPFLNGRPPQLGMFYRRRVLRLEPPYFLALCLCALTLLVSGYQPENAPSFNKSDASLLSSFGASLVYLNGLLFQNVPRLNPPLWSLEIEIQFYLLSPFLLLAYVRLGQRTRLVVAVVLAVATTAGNRLLDISQGRETFHHWTLLPYAYLFLLGIVVGDRAATAKPFANPPQTWPDLLILPALIAFGWTGVFEERTLRFALGIGVDGLRALCITLIFVAIARGRVTRAVVGNGWIALIGGMCYSIYLVHVPVMQVAATILYHVMPPENRGLSLAMSVVVLIPSAIGAGAVFYLLVERPCMEPNWPAKLLASIRRRGAPRGP